MDSVLLNFETKSLNTLHAYIGSWFLQGLLEPSLQVLQLDGNPLRRYNLQLPNRINESNRETYKDYISLTFKVFFAAYEEQFLIEEPKLY